MSEEQCFCHLNVGGNCYEVKDSKARNDIGDKTGLVTEEKTDMVSAINEVHNKNIEQSLDITALENRIGMEDIISDGSTTVMGFCNNMYNNKIQVVTNVTYLRGTGFWQENQVVRTLGYYDANDGGGATYLIRTRTDNDTDNNSTTIFVGTESSTLLAELINSDIVNVKQFGAKGDGVADDTQKIQYAINSCYESGTYKNKSLYFPKGEYLVSSPLTFSNTTIASSEYKNIKVYGDGMGSTKIKSVFNESGSVFNITSSHAFCLSDMSFVDGSSVDVTAVTIAGGMNINLKNLFAIYYNIGFNFYCYASTIENCWANSCNCGYYNANECTSLSMISCYASQITVNNSLNEYEGCGYYLKGVYSSLLNCASDSCVTAYYVKQGSFDFINCGFENNTNGFYINTSNNNDKGYVNIRGYLSDTTTNELVIINARKVTVYDHIFNETSNINVGNNLRNDVLNLINCNFIINNSSLYTNPIKLPMNGVGKNSIFWENDGKIQTGKIRVYTKELTIRIPKTGYAGGDNINVNINIKSETQYTWDHNSINEIMSFGYMYSSGYIPHPNISNSYITVENTTDDNYYYKKFSVNGAHAADKYIYDIEINTSIINVDLNNPGVTKIIGISGIDY